MVVQLRPWPADSLLATRWEAALRSSVAAGPLVVLNLDPGRIDTLCGAAAVEAGRTRQTAFEDPRRPEPFCRDRREGPERGLQCTQISWDQRTQIRIDVLIPGRPSVTGAIIGRPNPARYAVLYEQFLARVAAATCP